MSVYPHARKYGPISATSTMMSRPMRPTIASLLRRKRRSTILLRDRRWVSEPAPVVWAVATELPPATTSSDVPPEAEPASLRSAAPVRSTVWV